MFYAILIIWLTVYWIILIRSVFGCGQANISNKSKMLKLFLGALNNNGRIY